MDIKGLYSRRCFFWVFVVMLFLVGAFVFLGVLGRTYLFSAVPPGVLRAAAAQLPDHQAGFDRFFWFAGCLQDYFIPLVSGICLISAVVLWLLLRASFFRLMKQAGVLAETGGRAVKGKTSGLKSGTKAAAEAGALPSDKQASVEANHRFYLHLLSVLQREGRLVDFFAEELDSYEDAQIGAAVRSIHEGCRKALYKCIKPAAVIDKKEGEPLVVPEGFDSSEIRLTGNVTGEPPFNGVLRHRGWRAVRVELPTLTPGKDSMIIAPAEVEIL
jgi:hypothetical protein